jgi:IS30 family transposase
MVCATTIYGFT